MKADTKSSQAEKEQIPQGEDTILITRLSFYIGATAVRLTLWNFLCLTASGRKKPCCMTALTTAKKRRRSRSFHPPACPLLPGCLNGTS